MQELRIAASSSLMNARLSPKPRHLRMKPQKARHGIIVLPSSRCQPLGKNGVHRLRRFRRLRGETASSAKVTSTSRVHCARDNADFSACGSFLNPRNLRNLWILFFCQRTPLPIGELHDDPHISAKLPHHPAASSLSRTCCNSPGSGDSNLILPPPCG